MTGRLLDTAIDGGREIFHYDETEQKFAIQFTADVRPVIDANKAARATPQKFAGDMRRVASIPVWVVMEWVARFGVDPTAKGNWPLLRRLLNDPEWKWLRTSEGRV